MNGFTKGFDWPMLTDKYIIIYEFEPMVSLGSGVSK